MGRNDLYPFVLSPAVIDKLAFVHDLVGGGRATDGVAKGDEPGLAGIVQGHIRVTDATRCGRAVGVAHRGRRSGCVTVDLPVRLQYRTYVRRVTLLGTSCKFFLTRSTTCCLRRPADLQEPSFASDPGDP